MILVSCVNITYSIRVFIFSKIKFFLLFCHFYFYYFVLENFSYLNERIALLSLKCINELKKQGFSDNQLQTEPFLHLRYDGTDCALMCPAVNDSLVSSGTIHGDFLSGFLTRYESFFKITRFYSVNVSCKNMSVIFKSYWFRYQNEFGFTLSGRKIYVDDIRVRGIGKTLLNVDEESNESEEFPKIESVHFFKNYNF